MSFPLPFFSLRDLRVLALAMLALTLVACEDDAAPAEAPVLPVRTFRNLDARGDSTARNPMTGIETVIVARPRTYFNLRTGEIRSAVTDSNSLNWDIAFEALGIYTNNGVSGPGNGGAVVINDLFENVTTAPADNQFRIDRANNRDSLAIVQRPNTMPPAPLGWYTTGQIAGAPFQATLITPTPGRTIVVRCANGQFAKVQIQSYYLNAPDPAAVTVTTPARYYTFRWAIQTDGSRNLR